MLRTVARDARRRDARVGARDTIGARLPCACATTGVGAGPES